MLSTFPGCFLSYRERCNCCWFCSIALPCPLLSDESCRNFSPTMTSVRLLLLSLTFSSVCVSLGQPIPEANENGDRSHLDDILQRAESIILRSILKTAEEGEETNKGRRDIGAFSTLLRWRSLISLCLISGVCFSFL